MEAIASRTCRLTYSCGKSLARCCPAKFAVFRRLRDGTLVSGPNKTGNGGPRAFNFGEDIEPEFAPLDRILRRGDVLIEGAGELGYLHTEGCSDQGCPCPTALTPPGQTRRPQGADPHRQRRMHPQGPYLDEWPATVLLGRIPVTPQHFRSVEADPGRRVDPGRRGQRSDPRRRASRRAPRPAGHVPVAGRDADIVRKERPHPGAQLRITDVDGHRVTAFATNTKTGGPATQLPNLELRHRRRARCEDRIRISKDTGLMSLPLQGFAQNRIWCAIVALAAEITAWMQMLALNGHQARRWAPNRLRLRLFTLPATIARTGEQVRLRLATKAPWVNLVNEGVRRLGPRVGNP